MYMQAQNGLGTIDWNSIVKDVVGGYAAVKSVQTQADLVQAQAQAQAQQLAAQQAAQTAAIYRANPNYSATYSGQPAPSSNLMPILLIGGMALALFFVMKG